MRLTKRAKLGLVGTAYAKPRSELPSSSPRRLGPGVFLRRAGEEQPKV